MFKVLAEGDHVMTRVDGKQALFSLLQVPTTSQALAPAPAKPAEILSVHYSSRSANAKTQHSSTASVSAAVTKIEHYSVSSL